jgi:hypothetical protein
MPASKRWSSADINAAIERVATRCPGPARRRRAPRRGRDRGGARRPAPEDEITLTLMRLDVVGRLDLQGSRYTLPAAEAE